MSPTRMTTIAGLGGGLFFFKKPFSSFFAVILTLGVSTLLTVFML